MLIYHPLSHKNRGLKEKFDFLAETQTAQGVQFFRYNGLNESDVFKTPEKLPALLYFRRIDRPESEPDFVKEVVEFKNVRDFMLRDSTREQFVKAIDEFMA